MKRIAAVLCLAGAAGCMEPPKTGQYHQAISAMADLHVWHPTMQGQGNMAYDAVMGSMPEILPILVEYLTDETPTKIFHEPTGRVPKLCDVVFLTLLRLMRKSWEDFSNEGVFISSVISNPIFCINWDRSSRLRVQAKFRKLLEESE